MSSSINRIKDGVWEIELTRDDYFAINVSMTDKKIGEVITPTEGSLRFVVKKRYRDADEKILILKTIPLNTCLLRLEGDSIKLLAFREYVYDIEYTNARGHPNTFIKGVFKLTEKVFRGNGGLLINNIITRSHKNRNNNQNWQNNG